MLKEQASRSLMRQMNMSYKIQRKEHDEQDCPQAGNTLNVACNMLTVRERE